MNPTEPVGAALQLLDQVLRPFVTTEMESRHGADWEPMARAGLPAAAADAPLDLAALLHLVEKYWTTVFVARLSQADRGYVNELRGIRNQVVHERPFTAPDLRRAFDITARLLTALGATDEARQVTAQKAALVPAAVAPTVVARTSTRAPRASAPRKAASTTAAPKRSVLSKVAPKPQLRPSSGSFPRTASGMAPDLAALAAAFQAVCTPASRTFGSSALSTLGICDAAEGVQWSAALDRTTGHATLSVNLEGMEYDGWPVARLIERELQDTTLPAAARAVTAPLSVTVRWMRDCWQGPGRLPIREQDIAPTPFSLDRLTPALWRDALSEALGCLDAARHHRGRGLQTITMAGSGVMATKSVSPHLQFTVGLQRTGPDDSWEASMRTAKTLLTPLHEWADERARASHEPNTGLAQG